MRLIDADAMKRVYQEVRWSHVACIDCSFFMDDKYCRFETMLSEAPTINAIPVVRCEKCVAHGDCFAERVFVYTGIENPYCCAGERKDGDRNG